MADVQTDTKAQILDTAERLFASAGVAATSLRAITSEARVNLAAVHYHFGSKDGLVQAVFARRLGPLNATRLRLLSELEAQHPSGTPLPLEPLLDAFVSPVLELGLDPNGGEPIKRLLGRMYTEPGDLVRSIIHRQFAATAERFIPAFLRALPELPPEEVYWRIHFAIGTMAQTCADSSRLELISAGACDASGVAATRDRLLPFLAAGMRSRPPSAAEGERAP